MNSKTSLTKLQSTKRAGLIKPIYLIQTLKLMQTGLGLLQFAAFAKWDTW